MPYILLALMGAIILYWLVLKLKEADRKTLEASFRLTLTLLLVLLTVFSGLTERIGFVAAGVMGLILLYESHIRGFFKGRTKKYLPKDMTHEEAAQILGVPPEATEAEIQDAYHRLIAKNHPDHGGSKYIAQQLNQARELLLKMPK